MLDRLISGAGALTDRADRFARIFSRQGGGDALGHRPGSVVVAGILVVVAIALLLVGLEATDNPVPRTMAPAIGAGDAIGNRTYATISGRVSSAYVETYGDANANDVKDAGETTDSWYYFLVDPGTRTGVTVRSIRPPSEVFRLAATGKVVEDPDYIAEDASAFANSAAELGFTIDDHLLVDASLDAGPAPEAVDFAAGLPPDGTSVSVTGARSGAWVPVCGEDRDLDGTCDKDEVDAYDVVVYDPAARRGVIVVTRDSPEFTAATFTGMLRRDEHAVSEAQATEGLEYGDLGITVSDRYVLDDGRAPASAMLTFGLAGLSGITAGIILIGLAGGYLSYRRADAPLPAPATSLAIGERIPLRVTGILRAPGSGIHVREAPADLLRFGTAASGATTSDATEPGSTLIVERRGRPEGVAVGLGELTRLTAGTVFPLRGGRPALRAVAGTGPLLLSFDTEMERDRAAAELLEEAALDRLAPAPAAPEPDVPSTTAPESEPVTEET